MDFELIAFALGDLGWLTMAFVLGLLARAVGLPPLVGFLVAGFALNFLGVSGGEMIQKLSDLGITLLLFIVGLKLNLKTFARPQVWGVTALHMTLVVCAFGIAVYVLAAVGMPFLAGLDLPRSLLIAFALSFSSTVFVVKVLEEKGESSALHGRVAVGILIVQDLAAVAFLAVSTAKWPTYWALLVLLVVPLKPLLLRVLERVGHGELLVLCGLILALGGAQVFELLGLKGDLGALFLGVLVASHRKADELAKAMFGFKDLFLVAFFLSIGMSGQLSAAAVMIGAALTPFVILKSALFYGLLTAFKLRSRTSLLASLSLSNYSELSSRPSAWRTDGWATCGWSPWPSPFPYRAPPRPGWMSSPTEPTPATEGCGGACSDPRDFPTTSRSNWPVRRSPSWAWGALAPEHTTTCVIGTVGPSLAWISTPGRCSVCGRVGETCSWATQAMRISGTGSTPATRSNWCS